MSAKKKHPVQRRGTKPSAEKKPAIRATANAIPRITWRFGNFDHDGSWPLHGIEATTHLNLLTKLGHFETCTFAELSGDSGAKYIGIESIIPDAQRRLEKLNRDDCDGLWELHLGGLPRIWGIRDGEIMNLLWWDPNHLICPAHKRNT